MLAAMYVREIFGKLPNKSKSEEKQRSQQPRGSKLLDAPDRTLPLRFTLPKGDTEGVPTKFSKLRNTKKIPSGVGGGVWGRHPTCCTSFFTQRLDPPR